MVEEEAGGADVRGLSRGAHFCHSGQIYDSSVTGALQHGTEALRKGMTPKGKTCHTKKVTTGVIHVAEGCPLAI